MSKRIYTAVNGIARKAHVPKEDIETALIDSLRLLCQMERVLDDECNPDMLREEQERLSSFLYSYHKVLAPVMNEILQNELKAYAGDPKQFQYEWNRQFPSFPIHLKKRYTVALDKRTRREDFKTEGCQV